MDTTWSDSLPLCLTQRLMIWDTSCPHLLIFGEILKFERAIRYRIILEMTTHTQDITSVIRLHAVKIYIL